MKTGFIAIDHKPVQLSVAMEKVGTVPDRQSYNADTQAWFPDYGLSPVVFRPSVRVLDPSASKTRDVSAELTDVEWTEVADGVETLVTGTIPDPADPTKKKYTLTNAEGEAPALALNSNLMPLDTLGLRFSAKWRDPVSGAVYPVMLTCSVRCTNATRSVPDLIVDFAETSTWDPIYEWDSAVIPLAVSLRAGGKEVDRANVRLIWELMEDDGSWRAVDDLDWFVTVLDDGWTCRLDRSSMGSRADLRVRAKYDPDGDPDSVTLTDISPERRITCVRQLCYYDYDRLTPVEMAPGTQKINLRCRIHGDNGDLPDPERELAVIWYTATDVNVPVYKEVARGMDVMVPLGSVGQDGVMTAVDVKDRGHLRALTVNGKLLTINGKILLVRTA